MCSNRYNLDIALGICDNTKQRIWAGMDKATFIQTLTEERCNEFRLKLATKLDTELKVTRVAPLEDEGFDLLVQFDGTPSNAQEGINQAHQIRTMIEQSLGVTLKFIEMVPRQSFNWETKEIGFFSVVAWYRLA